jgi:hypothetical protein
MRLRSDRLVNEAAVSGKILEVSRAAQQELVASAFLRCPWALSIAPFSCATPRSLRDGVMP